MSLVIAGASGHLGRRVAELLAEEEPRRELVLVTRTPDAVAGFATQNVKVRYGALEDRRSLLEAFTGGDRLLLISAGPDAVGRRVALHREAVEAAVAVGISHIVYTSHANPGADNPASAVIEHRQTEEIIQHSGLAWTFLRNSIYAEQEVKRGAVAVASGRLVTNRGEGRHAFVWRDDCAAAAAAAMTRDARRLRAAYEVTGPVLVSPAEEARMLSDITGRVIRVEAMDDEAFAQWWTSSTGTLIEETRSRSQMGRAIREGHLAIQSTAVEELTGRPPRTLEDRFVAQLDDLLQSGG